jgi:1-acyl-sn-glycerol-3-phosphate acyltransferase
LVLLSPLLKLSVEGLEHVPRSGPVLVVANHLHNADPVLLSVAFPRPLHFMAKRELFSVPIVAPIIRAVGAFPIDRGKADRTALRRAEQTLGQGIAVGMFPEGTRSRTGTLSRAHPGAALIALRSGAPVLPAVIVGSERLPGNGIRSRLRRGERGDGPRRWGVSIRFGQPVVLTRDHASGRAGADVATERMMVELARLLPPEYRGDYAGLAASMTTLGEQEASPPRDERVAPSADHA